MSTATLPVADQAEIVFSEGIIGVPRARRFRLLERPGDPIRLLECLDIPNFSLPVVDPRLADPRYEPRLSPRITQILGIDEGHALLMLAITSRDESGPVANLRAPLVINVHRQIGTQTILDDRSLPLRAPVELGS